MVPGIMGLRRLGGMLCRGIGVLCVVRAIVVLFVPWDGWILQDLHGFCKWVFDALALLNDFTWQVVVSRKDAGLHMWANWLREDLDSRPYAWLRPDFVLPLPFLVV